MRQTIYERVKDRHEEESNSSELADQPRYLTTKPTVLDRHCELLYSRVKSLIYDVH